MNCEYITGIPVENCNELIFYCENIFKEELKKDKNKKAFAKALYIQIIQQEINKIYLPDRKKLFTQISLKNDSKSLLYKNALKESIHAYKQGIEKEK